MAALPKIISYEHKMNLSYVNYNNKNAKPVDLKKEMLRKTIECYKFSNSGNFDGECFQRDMIDILYSSLVNLNNDNNYNIDKYIKKIVINTLETINKMVIEMKNDRENKRNALVNKLKLEHVKFLNSPTAKLMIQINKDYGKWEPGKKLHELPLLPISLSDEIDSGREERI